MAHHKRQGPKSTRAGCLLCKPHKRQGVDEPRRQEEQARTDAREQLEVSASDSSRYGVRRPEHKTPGSGGSV